MNKYHVMGYYTDVEGTRRLGKVGTFYADTEADAIECAMDAWWDPRWEDGGDRPCFTAKLVQDRRTMFTF